VESRNVGLPNDCLDCAELNRCDVGVIKAEHWRGSSAFAGLRRPTFWIPGFAEDDGIQAKRRITHRSPPKPTILNLR
jgi:hypothetical protein